MVTIRIRTHPSLHWAQIAVEHEQEAVQARHHTNPDRVDAPALEREIHAAMITIVAAAFAIEAWRNAVEENIPGNPPNAGKSHTRIIRSLERGFEIDKPQVDQWFRELE
jgi:hypothetical protein